MFLLLLAFLDIGLGILDAFLELLNVGFGEADQVLHLLAVSASLFFMVELLRADRDELLTLALAFLLNSLDFLDALLVIHV